MAQPQLEPFNRRGFAARIQPVPGTPVAVNPATDGLRFYDGQSGTEFDTLEENRDKSFFSGNEFTTYNHRAFIEGTTHIYPPATPGAANGGTPDCHTLLLISGMAQTLDNAAGTTRYAPISSNIPMATAKFFHAGTVKEVFDARANISSLSMEIGNRARAQLRVQGFYDAVQEQQMPPVTVPETFGPVIEASNTTTRLVQYPGGVASASLLVWAKALTIDFGSQVASKEYTEHKETGIAGRQPTFNLRIARTAKGDFDPFAVRKAGTYIAASMRVNNSDGRYTQLRARGLVREINEVDIDGDYGWEISGPCIATSAGGDEFDIAFGTAP